MGISRMWDSSKISINAYKELKLVKQKKLLVSSIKFNKNVNHVNI